jgi:hypothetical protein
MYSNIFEMIHIEKIREHAMLSFQELLRHASSKTTEIGTQFSKQAFDKIRNPPFNFFHSQKNGKRKNQALRLPYQMKIYYGFYPNLTG